MLRLKYDTELSPSQFLTLPKLIKYCGDYECSPQFVKEELELLGIGLPNDIPDYAAFLGLCSSKINELYLSCRNYSSIFESYSRGSGFVAMDYSVIQSIRKTDTDNGILQHLEGNDVCQKAVDLSLGYSAAIILIVNFLQSFFMQSVWDKGEDISRELLSQFSPSHSFLSDCTYYCDAVKCLMMGINFLDRNDILKALLLELGAISNHVGLCALVTDFLANGYHVDERSKKYDRKPEIDVYKKLWTMIQGVFKGAKIYIIVFSGSPIREQTPVPQRGQNDCTTRMKVFYQHSNCFYVLRFDCSHKGEEFYHMNVMDENGNPNEQFDHDLILPDDTGVQEAFMRLRDYIIGIMPNTTIRANSNKDDDLKCLQSLRNNYDLAHSWAQQAL